MAEQDRYRDWPPGDRQRFDERYPQDDRYGRRRHEGDWPGQGGQQGEREQHAQHGGQRWPGEGAPRGEGQGGYTGEGYGQPRRQRGQDERGSYGYGYAAGQGSGPDYGYGRDGSHGQSDWPDFGYGRGGSVRGSERYMHGIRSWGGEQGGFGRGGEGSGQHRGRGPKNYARSDERIREDVCDRLSDDPHVDASEIEVAISNGEVTLTGTVNSRDERRAAEDCAEAVSGVKHVQNNVRVQAETRQDEERWRSSAEQTMTGSLGSPTSGDNRQQQNQGSRAKRA